MILAFVVALSVIVAVHEYGHYIVGRWSGIKADVFSLGFGPVLWSRFDKHGTQWQIALLPFGGYVKFKGDANAASANADASALQEMSPEERRQTMLGAPLWARTLTVAAGPVFNFILSILLFGTIALFQGRTIEPLTIGDIQDLPFEEISLQPGDQLLRVAGVDFPASDDADISFDDFIDQLPLKPVLDYDVLRDGREITVKGPYPLMPLVQQVAPRSAAYASGLQAGDLIIEADGTPLVAFGQFKDMVEASQGRALHLKVWRAGEVKDITLAPRRVDEPQPEGGFKTEWRIGIVGGMAFEPATETLGPVEAFMAGVSQTYRVAASSLSGMYHLIAGKISSCNMSGPIGIAQVSGAMASQGAESFIFFIAVLSTAVGLLNLFPIPVLDGGHLVFYAYEAVARKPPSDGVLRILMFAGLTLVLSLMTFALFNDVFCP
jgi:regulator of sigma E protease